jgi:putative flippase GtrA
LLALTGSFLVPYVRARGEALGVQIKDAGFIQRPERVLLLGAGTALSPVLEVIVAPADPHPPHRLAIAAIVAIGIGSHASAIQRLVVLLRRLSEIRPDSRSGSRRPLKSAIANAAATAADFALASTLFYVLSFHASVSTAAGCAVGAVASFVLSRGWVFDAGTGRALPQFARYGAVSLVTMVLNAGGVALLLLLHVPFFAAWCVARCVVFAAWSYPVQRDFVFAEDRRAAAAAIASAEPSGVSRL